jgi:hypothetical protein
VPAPFLYSPPLLVVRDAGARLVRRGLLAPSDAACWLGARVLVFRRGPVVCELLLGPSRGTRTSEQVAPAGPAGDAR